jgi:hypothetical protein
MSHPLNHRRKIEAPVETVLVGSQVAFAVLIESEGMKSAAEAGFQIDKHRIDPAGFRQFFGMTTPHDHWLMKATDFCIGTEAGPGLIQRVNPDLFPAVSLLSPAAP